MITIEALAKIQETFPDVKGIVVDNLAFDAFVEYLAEYTTNPVQDGKHRPIIYCSPRGMLTIYRDKP